jgi:hypothetical protein
MKTLLSSARVALNRKGFLVGVWYPVAMGMMGAGLWASLSHFPTQFDWRYQVVSSVISDVDNPNGNHFLCIGLGVVSAMLFPLGRYLALRLSISGPKLAAIASHTFRMGVVTTGLVALERGLFHDLSRELHKAHEYLALIAFAGLFTSVTCFWYLALRSYFSSSKWPAFSQVGFFFATAAPLLGAALSQAYLYFVPNQLGWVGPHWATLGVPVYLSLAFWEWIATVAVFTYLYILLIAVPATPQQR